MRINRSFIKGSIIYTAIGALPMASAVLLLPFYMADLTASSFGTLSVYLAFSLLTQLLVTYSFDTSLYIHYHEFKNDRATLSRFVSSAFVLMLVIGCALAIILLPGGAYILSWFSDENNLAFYPNGWLALGGGVFQALFKVHSNLLQSREKPETFFWANLVLFSAIFGFTLLGLKLYPQTLIGPLGGRFLALGLGSFWVLYRIFREFGFHFDLPLLGTSFSFNFYSFIYQLQQWLINYFDRIVMLFYLPLASVGVYDFAIKSLVGVELVMNGLHSALLPRVLKLINIRETKSTSPEINRYYHGFISVIMIVVCGAIWLVPLAIEWLSDLLGKPGYLGSIDLVPYIAVLYIGRTVRLFFGLPYSILKYTKPLPVIYAVVAAVKIGGMFLLIPYWGVMGVVVSTAGSVLTEVVMLYLLSRHRFTFKFNSYKILIGPIALIALVVAGELTPMFPSDVRHFFYCVLATFMLGFVYRFELRNLKPAIRDN